MVAMSIFLFGCTTNAIYAPIVEAPPNERLRIGRIMEERISRITDRPPIFEVRRELNAFELKILNEFVAAIPSGRLIVGGYPVLWIDVRYAERVVFKLQKEISYTVTIGLSGSERVLFESKRSGTCLEAEGLYVHPIRCSLLRPQLFTVTLERL